MGQVFRAAKFTGSSNVCCPPLGVATEPPRMCEYLQGPKLLSSDVSNMYTHIGRIKYFNDPSILNVYQYLFYFQMFTSGSWKH